MKEYCILIKNKNGFPYILDTFTSIENAKIKLMDIISLEEERNRFYFVDNDFYNNKYPFNSNGKYLCIKEREVTSWINYSEKNNEIEKDKIINFFNYYKN